MDEIKKVNFSRLILIGILFVSGFFFNLPDKVVASDVSNLQQQQKNVQQELDQNNDQLAAKVATVNQTYQQLKSIQQQQSKTSNNLKQAKIQLAVAKKQKKQRVSQEKIRLRDLQQTEGTQSGLQFLQQSRSFSQWLGNLVALSRLQSAYNQSLTAVSESIKDLHNSQKKLTLAQASLKQQAGQIATKKAELNDSIQKLQNLVNSNQQKIKLLANQVSWAKNSEKEQQAAAETTSAAVSSSSESSSTTSSSSSSTKVSNSNNSQSTLDSSSDSSSESNNGKTLTMQATGYSTAEAGASSYSALGINLQQHPSCVAVDPSVIPLGSVIWVSGYGVSIAGDTGGAIKGNIIDLHFSSVAQATAWGRKNVTVKVLN